MRMFGAQTWPAAASSRPVLVVPLGSMEQHGPHLPLDTDTRIAHAVADRLVRSLAGLILAPAVPYGASGEHAGFPGTLSLGTTVLRHLLVELVRSADESASGVVLINGHGGNIAAVRAAAAQLDAEGRRVCAWAPRAELATRCGVPDAAGDLHAGRTETSLILHLAPSLARPDEAVSGPTPALVDLVRHGVRRLSPSGVLGDPRGANAAEGAALLDAYAADAAAQVNAWFGPGEARKKLDESA